MKKLTIQIGLAAAVLTAFGVSTTATAHHNYVSHYDMEAAPVTITGTVDSFWFVNPHIRVYVKAAHPETQEEAMWVIEGRSRSILAREGWKGDEIKKGDTVTLTGTPARKESMKTHMLLKGDIKVEGGEVINFSPPEKKVKDLEFDLGGDQGMTKASHLDRGSRDGAGMGAAATAASAAGVAGGAMGAMGAPNNAPVEGAKKPPIPRNLKVGSSFVKDGGVLPETSKCSRDGGDGLTIPVSWSEAPEGTKSYGVVMSHYPNNSVPGVDTPSHYWLLWNIPANVTELPHGNPASIGDEGSDKDGTRTGYTPPCSPPGEVKHSYTMAVYALSEAPTGLGKSDNPKVRYTDFMQAIDGKVLDAGSFKFLN